MASSLLVSVTLSAVLQAAQVVPAARPCVDLPPPTTLSGVHTLCVPETGAYESYRLERPAFLVPGVSYPLIVLFHGSTGSHAELGSTSPPWDSYGFVQAAIDRGYIVMMHDGGRAPAPHAFATFGNEAFQAHTRAAMRAVLDSFGPVIDRNRVYGYGFSMGGGELLNFSARHLDPSAPWGMFAAVVNHTGGLSLRMTAASNVPANIATAFNTIFGVHYLTDPFAYQRASVIDTLCFHTSSDCTSFPCSPANVETESSLALNLRWQSGKTFFDTCEGNKNLTQSCQLLGTVLGANTFHKFKLLGDGAAALGHSWSILDPAEVLAVFDANVLDTTSGGFLSGDTLFADDDRRVWALSAERINPGDFGRLKWSVAPTRDQIIVLMDSAFSLPSNVGALGVSVGSGSALRDDVCLEIILEADLPVTVRGYSGPPVGVFTTGCVPVPFTWTAGGELLLPPLGVGAGPVIRTIKPFVGAGCCP